MDHTPGTAKARRCKEDAPAPEEDLQGRGDKIGAPSDQDPRPDFQHKHWP